MAAQDLNSLLNRIAHGHAGGLSAAEFETLVEQVPNGFDGLAELDLISQLPVIRHQAAEAKPRLSDPAPLLKQLKGLTRAYRREFAGGDELERFQPGTVLAYVDRLEALMAEAQDAGWQPEALLAKADSLTCKIVSTMAVLGMLARKERN